MLCVHVCACGIWRVCMRMCYVCVCTCGMCVHVCCGVCASVACVHVLWCVCVLFVVYACGMCVWCTRVVCAVWGVWMLRGKSEEAGMGNIEDRLKTNARGRFWGSLHASCPVRLKVFRTKASHSVSHWLPLQGGWRHGCCVCRARSHTEGQGSLPPSFTSRGGTGEENVVGGEGLCRRPSERPWRAGSGRPVGGHRAHKPRSPLEVCSLTRALQASVRRGVAVDMQLKPCVAAEGRHACSGAPCPAWRRRSPRCRGRDGWRRAGPRPSENSGRSRRCWSSGGGEAPVPGPCRPEPVGPPERTGCC